MRLIEPMSRVAGPMDHGENQLLRFQAGARNFQGQKATRDSIIGIGRHLEQEVEETELIGDVGGLRRVARGGEVD